MSDILPLSGCGSDGDVRLVDGFFPNVGRVEVCQNDNWITACDTGFDDTDARVVCRQLGFPDPGGIASSI